MEIISILGMHRSGTSLVSRMVNLLGVDLGPEDRLMPPKPDNPAGFWESLPITQLNDDLLAELGGRWDEPPLLADDWFRVERFDVYRERARLLVEELFDDVDIAGWKDPRMSLLVGFWRDVVPLGPSVISIRDPGEVAASLRARDGIDEEKAAHLWLRYVVAAFANEPDAMVIRYAQLFEAPDATVDRLVAHLGLPEPSEEVREAIRSVIDPSLRRARASEKRPGPAMAAAGLLFEQIDDPRIPAACAWLYDSWRGRLRGTEAEEAERDAERADLLEQRDRGIARIEELERDAVDLIGQRDELATQRDRAVERMQALDGDLEALVRNRDEATAERDRAVEQMAALEEDLRSQRDRAVERMQTIEEDLREQRDRAVDRMHEVEAELIGERDELRERLVRSEEHRRLQDELLGRTERDLERVGKRLVSVESEAAAVRKRLAQMEKRRWDARVRKLLRRA